MQSIILQTNCTETERKPICFNKIQFCSETEKKPKFISTKFNFVEKFGFLSVSVDFVCKIMFCIYFILHELRHTHP